MPHFEGISQYVVSPSDGNPGSILIIRYKCIYVKHSPATGRDILLRKNRWRTISEPLAFTFTVECKGGEPEIAELRFDINGDGEYADTTVPIKAASLITAALPRMPGGGIGLPSVF